MGLGIGHLAEADQVVARLPDHVIELLTGFFDLHGYGLHGVNGNSFGRGECS